MMNYFTKSKQSQISGQKSEWIFSTKLLMSFLKHSEEITFDVCHGSFKRVKHKGKKS